MNDDESTHDQLAHRSLKSVSRRSGALQVAGWRLAQDLPCVRFWTAAYRAALSEGLSDEDAQECASRALERFTTAGRNWESIADVEAYGRRCGLNAVRDHRRSTKPHTEADHDLPSSSDHARSIASSDFERRFRAMIRKWLSEREARVIVLHYLRHKSIEEIAPRVHASPVNVKTILTRALRCLRQKESAIVRLLGVEGGQRRLDFAALLEG